MNFPCSRVKGTEQHVLPPSTHPQLPRRGCRVCAARGRLRRRRLCRGVRASPPPRLPPRRPRRTERPARSHSPAACAPTACRHSPTLRSPPTGPKATAQHLAASNPRFPVAQRACNHLLPNGGSGSQEAAHQTRTRLADELSFARCMRSHGVSRFSDPTAQGGLSVEMVQALGIDVHSPAVLRVVQACLPRVARRAHTREGQRGAQQCPRLTAVRRKPGK